MWGDNNIKNILIFQAAEKAFQQWNKNSMPQKKENITPRKKILQIKTIK